jgi:hypothetical protein
LWSTTREAVSDGGKSAEAAIKAAEAATRQADAAERALSTLERGYIFVHRFEAKFWPIKRIAGPESPWMQPAGLLFLVNRGRTPVIVKGFISRVTLSQHGPEIPDYTGADEGIGELVLSAGEISTFPLLFQFAGIVTDEDVAMMETRSRTIFIVCRIRYEDIFGSEHLRGTAVVYDHLSQLFMTVGGKRFNYDRRVTEQDTRTDFD